MFEKLIKSIKSGFSKNGYLREYNDDEHPIARVIKKIGYSLLETAGRDEFEEPEFDFEEIIMAYNSDGYVRQAIDKYIELMFKSGYKIVYKDQGVREYVEGRIAMISDAMGQPFSQFIKQISEDLVKFHNVFIAKARQSPEEMPDIPGINIDRVGEQDPVAGYFRIPVETMSVKVDEHGTVERFLQETDDEELEFNPEDMIHIPYKQPAGKFFGVPFLLPVLDDIKLLRQVEDNIAQLIYRHLYPLFIYQVGLPEEGQESSDEEIEEVQEDLRNMPIDGGLVIPERHNIDLKAPDSNIDAKGYLEYFERRSFTGLGVSETIMGRSATSNKSTAENQSAEMRDKVKSFMSVIEDYVTHYILREILLEGGYNPILNPEHRVYFEFNEIDTNLLIKEENHAVFMFEHNAITHEEMRESIHRDPIDDESRLNDNMFNYSGSGDDTDNRNEPENQHSSTEQLINTNINYCLSRIMAKFNQFKEEFKKLANSPYNYNNRQVKSQQLVELYWHKLMTYTNLYTNRILTENLTENIDIDKDEIDKVLSEKLSGLKNKLINDTTKVLKEDSSVAGINVLLKKKQEEIQSSIYKAINETYIDYHDRKEEDID